jgi:hypothetical protein
MKITCPTGKLFLVLFAAIIGAGGLRLAAQTTTWTGAISTDWNIAGNWSAGVPGSGDSVVIAPASRMPVTGGDFIRTLTI